MNLPKFIKTLKIAPALTAALALFLTPSARAVPYASCITNDFGGNTVFYYLNEDADNVKFIVGTTTNDLGALSKGLHTVSVGGATSYQFEVGKSVSPTWVRTADDVLGGTNVNKFLRFFSPGGVAVNRNSKNLSLFGRIYVLENVGGATASTGTPRTDTEGIYVLNADQSDALGQNDTALNGGLTWIAGSVSASDGPKSPWKVEVGDDDNIYIADYSTNNGGVFRVGPDITSGETVLATPGRNSNIGVHTDCNGSAIAKGSLAGGNLQLWTIDGAWPSGGFNRLLRYDINSGPLPWNTPPSATNRTAGVPTVADVQADLDIAPDGKFFLSQSRSALTGAYTADRVNIRVLDPDGLTVLWDSLAQSTNALGNATAADIFADAYSIKVSFDGKRVAIARADTQTWIMSLTNGIPDISTRLLINTFAGTSASTAANRRREVSFDVAGNLYAGNNSLERVVIWSPGGTTTAVTIYNNGTGQGSFQVVVPPATVTVTNTIPTATEGGSSGRFTVSRAGDSSGSITVNYVMTGTATNGTDYSTLSGTVTFLPGATSTNIDVAALTDADAEFTETAIITVAAGTGYAVGLPSSATVSILDVHTPEISISGDTSAGARTNLLESFPDSRAVFPLTRKGTLSSSVTVNLSYSGTAANGADFSGPATITFLANAVTTNLSLSPINDPAVEGPEEFTVTVASGGGYAPGTPASAGGLVYSEDLAPVPVTLFSDKFDTDTSGNWVVNTSSGSENDAAFGFDYSAFAIPEAPSSSGGFTPTRGLKLRSHLTTAAVLTGISASPLNGNFAGDHRLRFDLWMNYIGPLPLGGAGSTEHSSFGIGTSGTSLVWPTATDGIWFTAATDSDVADTSTTQADYGAFAGALVPANSGFYGAGSGTDARGNGNPHYSGFGGSSVPAQQALFSTQSGAVRIGALGMAWHSVTIAKLGDEVTWDVDGLRIATIPISSTVGSLSTNFFLGFHDWFTSTNANPNLEFALYDNVRVESLAPSLNITSIQVINGGADVQIDFTGSTSDTDTSFTLQSSGTVDSGYVDVSSTITVQSPGVFRAVKPVSGSVQYYRIRHL